VLFFLIFIIQILGCGSFTGINESIESYTFEFSTEELIIAIDKLLIETPEYYDGVDEDEWLSLILNEQKGLNEFDGCTYSVFQNEELVSVIGIAYPDKKDPCFGITNIAVKPILRSTGIGKRIFKKIMKLHPLKKGQYWIAPVDKSNLKAKK